MTNWNLGLYNLNKNHHFNKDTFNNIIGDTKKKYF